MLMSTLFLFFSVFAACKSIYSQSTDAWGYCEYAIDTTFEGAASYCNILSNEQLPIIKSRSMISDFKNWLQVISNKTDFPGEITFFLSYKTLGFLSVFTTKTHQRRKVLFAYLLSGWVIEG